MLVALLVVLVLVGLNALYVAAEFSAVSVRRSRVQQLAEDGQRLAIRLLPAIGDVRQLDNYIAACQVGITLTSLVLGAYGQASITPTVTTWFLPWAEDDYQWSYSMASVTTLIVLTVFQVVVGELVPKTVALQFSTRTALLTVLPMEWSLAVYKPFIRILNGSGIAVLRLFGVRQSGHRHIHSPDELELLIAESRDGGLLEPDEHRRLERALRLRLRTARELMVPWVEVQAVDLRADLGALLDTLALSTYTRVPVYSGAPDHVVGILNTKKLALRRLQGAVPGSVAELLQPAVTTMPSTSGDRLLALFQEQRTHHAIVLDESGRALGLVTLEDVLRVFLGVMPDDVAASKMVADGGRA